jgi:hypothetical protein
MATKVRHIRVPDDVWEAATARAYAERTTASAVVVEALREYGRPGTADAPGGRPRVIARTHTPVREGGRAEVIVRDAESRQEQPDCRHPSASVVDGTCQDCGQDVWLP